MSLNTSNDQSKVHLSLETRDKLKIISPATNELISQMINDEGYYKKHGRGVIGATASWEIRSAMNANGYYRDFKSAENQYKLIATDINNYCGNNETECRASLVPMILWKNSYSRTLWPVSRKHFLELIRFSVYPPKENLTERNWDDADFRYAVARTFNMNTQYEPRLESKIYPIISSEKKKQRKISSLYRFYQKNFYILASMALLISIVLISSRHSTTHRSVFIICTECFLLTFAINILIGVSSVDNVARPLMTSSIPLICFTAYFLGQVIEKLVTIPSNYFKSA